MHTELNNEYEEKVVCSTRCLVWNWTRTHSHDKKEAAKETKRRKTIKDQIGKENLDTPMIDSKMTDNGMVFCDIIIYTNFPALWYNSCQKYFENSEIHKKSIASGQQLILYCDGQVMYTINFYLKTKSKSHIIMVQPGDRNQDNLLRFLTIFDDLRDLQSEMSNATSLVASEEDQTLLATRSTSTPMHQPHPSDNHDVTHEKVDEVSLDCSFIEEVAAIELIASTNQTHPSLAQTISQTTPVSYVQQPLNKVNQLLQTPRHVTQKTTDVTDELSMSMSLLTITSPETKPTTTSNTKNTQTGLHDGLPIYVSVSTQYSASNHVDMCVQTMSNTQSTFTQTAEEEETTQYAANSHSDMCVQTMIDTRSTFTQTAENDEATHPVMSPAVPSPDQLDESATNPMITESVSPVNKTDVAIQVNETIHVDELLCFVQNCMMTGLGDIITKLCVDFYSQDVIFKSKAKLFDHTVSIRPSNMRYIKRKNKEGCKQDILDIMNVFRTLPVKSTPIYVAKDLSNLPPLGAFDNDVLSMHREVEEIKTNMRVMMDVRHDVSQLAKTVQELNNIKTEEIKSSIKAMTEVRHDVTQLAKTVQEVHGIKAEENKSNIMKVMLDVRHDVSQLAKSVQEANKEDTKLTVNDSAPSVKSSDPSVSTNHSVTSKTFQQVVKTSIPNLGDISSGPKQSVIANSSRSSTISDQSTPPTSSQTPDLNPQDASEESDVTDSVNDNHNISTGDETSGEDNNTAWSTHHRQPKYFRNSGKTRNSKVVIGTGHKGNLQVKPKPVRNSENQRNSKVVIGTGPKGDLQVNHPRHSKKDTDKGNKQITGVFISRFGSATSTEQIALHIRRETGLKVRPEKVTTKYQEYSSFYIPAESKVRNVLLDSNTWPRDALIKPYFS
jgi:hypothetical protein